MGIMLPASVTATVVYLSTLFAGKTPVMINWTVGRRNVLHALDLTQTRGDVGIVVEHQLQVGFRVHLMAFRSILPRRDCRALEMAAAGMSLADCTPRSK